MIDRRALLVSALATAASRSALAQPAVARVAWLSPSSAADSSVFFEELREGLRESGYVQPRNLTLTPYYADSSVERLTALIGEIIAAQPHVIVAQGSAAPALRRSASTLPGIFGYSGDPVEAGLVDSLARPGRNLTGISYMTLELVGKRLELMKEVLPRVRRIAVVANPQHPGDPAERRASEAAAAALGLTQQFFEARSIAQLDAVLPEIEAAGVDAVMLFPVQNVISRRAEIARWSMRTRIPAVSGWAQFAEGGNLMSYGPNLRAASRRLAAFVDRVLKGARPADLPVELPAKVEFVLNLKAAKVLGIDIPAQLLARADDVIE